jgi:hypothetical protein
LKMPPSFRYTLENLEIIRKFLTNTRVDNNKTVLEFRGSSRGSLTSILSGIY